MRAKPILAGVLPWRESLDRSCRSGAFAAIAPGAELLQLRLERTNSGPVIYRYGGETQTTRLSYDPGERMPVNVSLSPMK